MVEKKKFSVSLISFFIGAMGMLVVLVVIGLYSLYFIDYDDSEEFDLVSYVNLTEDEKSEVVDNTCQVFCSMLPLDLGIDSYNWSLSTEEAVNIECYCMNKLDFVVASQIMYVEIGGVVNGREI